MDYQQNDLTKEEQLKRKLLSEEGLACGDCGKDIQTEGMKTDGYTCIECWSKTFAADEKAEVRKRCDTCGWTIGIDCTC